MFKLKRTKDLPREPPSSSLMRLKSIMTKSVHLMYKSESSRQLIQTWTVRSKATRSSSKKLTKRLMQLKERNVNKSKTQVIKMPNLIEHLRNLISTNCSSERPDCKKLAKMNNLEEIWIDLLMRIKEWRGREMSYCKHLKSRWSLSTCWRDRRCILNPLNYLHSQRMNSSRLLN